MLPQARRRPTLRLRRTALALTLLGSLAGAASGFGPAQETPQTEPVRGGAPGRERPRIGLVLSEDLRQEGKVEVEGRRHSF